MVLRVLVPAAVGSWVQVTRQGTVGGLIVVSAHEIQSIGKIVVVYLEDQECSSG